MTNLLPSLSELELQDFIGKQELLELAIAGVLHFAKLKEADCSELHERYIRFLERTSPDTNHKAYVCASIKQLVDVLITYGNDTCTVLEYTVEPFYIYSVYLHKNSRRVFGVIKGYDIQKMSEAEWHQIWGAPPIS